MKFFASQIFASLCLIALLPAMQIHAQMSSVMTIREARTRPLGAVVTVAGRVTVAGELGGTSHLQDSTGGLAVFNSAFTQAVKIGDSVQITGPLSEFQATTGQVGTGLLQISGTGTTFALVSAPRVAPAPREITPAQITEAVEGQLVNLTSVVFSTTGTFGGNVNYWAVNAAGASVQIRINSATNLVNLRIPTGNQNIIGVLGQFRGTYQISPRFAADLGLQVTKNPGDTVPKSRTFDVTTWNIKWFGLPTGSSGERLGPADSLLQLRNVIRVIDSIDADLYGVQEVSNLPLFRRIVDSLPRYGYVVAPFNQTQRTAFLFKKSIVDTVASRTVLTNTSFAAGRFPFLLDFYAKDSNGIAKPFYAIVIHAKAGSTDRDYMIRTADAQALYELLKSIRGNSSGLLANVLLMGDFNDGLTTSIVGGQASPYAPFMQDTTFFFSATLALAQQGLTSFSGGTTLIDHFIMNRWLRLGLFVGAEKIDNPSYIPSYVSTTSDHFPVTARFFLEKVIRSPVGNVYESPIATQLQVSPNPASQLISVRYTLEQAAATSLELMDALGTVTVSEPRTMRQAGEHRATVDTSHLTNGVYWLRVRVHNTASSQESGNHTFRVAPVIISR